MLRFKAAAKVASRKSACILTVSAQCAQVRNPSYLKECTVAAAKCRVRGGKGRGGHTRSSTGYGKYGITKRLVKLRN